jgi:hypothetical protein
MRPIIGAVCCAVLLSGSAWGATVEPAPRGQASVNQGDGFHAVNARIDANVGDSVMVGPGGNAAVVYDDGCKVNVQPGSVTTIAPISPCASGSYAQDNSNNYYNATALGAIAVIGGVAGVLIYEGTKSSSP